MKKIFYLFILSAFSSAVFAGDGDMKNFRFGVTGLGSLMWYKPDDLKKFDKKGGNVLRGGAMINAEYSSATGRFALGFGIGIGTLGGKINFLDSVHYYFVDDAIVRPNDPNINVKPTNHYLLKTREYKATYFHIPISLKMRTNEIGYMRYFAEPRLNIGIKKKVRANDEVLAWGSSGSTVTNPNVDITDDMANLRMSFTISGGAEYYLSGSTAVVFTIGYDLGLSNSVQGTSDYLLRTKGDYTVASNTNLLDQKFAQNAVTLSVGILF